MPLLNNFPHLDCRYKLLAANIQLCGHYLQMALIKMNPPPLWPFDFPKVSLIFLPRSKYRILCPNWHGRNISSENRKKNCLDEKNVNFYSKNGKIEKKRRFPIIKLTILRSESLQFLYLKLHPGLFRRKNWK